MTEPVTDEDILELSDYAWASHDFATARLCDRALDGDGEAREICEQAIMKGRS